MANENEIDDFRGNQPKGAAELAEWLARAPVTPAIEPGLPIVDPHHHLFGAATDRQHYRLQDLQRDADSGHRLLGTVYVEAYDAGWRTEGPPALRPVGEVETIVRIAAGPIATAAGPCEVAAGIVCHADLTLGDAVVDVLQAQVEAGQGRLRGVRMRAATVEGIVGRFNPSQRKPQLLGDADFRRGYARLGEFGLSFDAWVYHTQLAELVELADAFPMTPIVVNHLGGPIGVAEFRPRRDEVLFEWQGALRALARRPNVVMKIGGLGMPVIGLGFERRVTPASAHELAPAWKPYIESCVAAFGASRCMFESNFPIDKQSCSHGDLWNAFKLATQGWSPQERRDLFYRTACRTYRLPALAARGDELCEGPSGI